MSKKIDREYATPLVEEMKWLKAHGFRYTFVKTIDEITIYKYLKTPELFYSLAIFYEENRKETEKR